MSYHLILKHNLRQASNNLENLFQRNSEFEISGLAITEKIIDVKTLFCILAGNCRGLESSETPNRRYLPVEIESFQAFEWLHAQIDDDKDGELNARETGDFLAEELQAGSGAHQRHASFHSKHDSHISLQELWDNWQVSNIFG